jgi:biopolymer transport protein TolR
MSMNVGGGGGGFSADINMTPMIDVLLVLLIIFMVVQQSLQKGLSVQVPPMESVASGESVDQIVLEVLGSNSFELNQQPLTRAQLQPRLIEVFDPRPRKVIFVEGAENAAYGDVLFAVDAARAARIDIVGWVPRKPGAAPAAPAAPAG